MTDVFGYWRWLPPGPIYGAPIWNAVGWMAVGGIAVLGLRHVQAAEQRSGLVLPLFCGFVAWNGFLSNFDPAWIALVAFAVWLGLPQKSNIGSE